MPRWWPAATARILFAFDGSLEEVHSTPPVVLPLREPGHVSLSCGSLRSSDKECRSSDHLGTCRSCQRVPEHSSRFFWAGTSVAKSSTSCAGLGGWPQSTRPHKRSENLLATTLPHSSLISHPPPSDAYLFIHRTIDRISSYLLLHLVSPATNLNHWLAVASDITCAII